MMSVSADAAVGAASLLHTYGGAIGLGVTAVLAPALAGLAASVHGARRRAWIWQEAARQSALDSATLLPDLRGVAGTCRGRDIQARLVGPDTLHVTARAVNPAHLLDRLSSVGVWTAAALPEASWLSEIAHAELTALTFSPSDGGGLRRRPRPDWQVRVRDHAVTVACAGVPLRPERVRFLIGLACDLAESVDGFAAATDPKAA